MEQHFGRDVRRLEDDVRARLEQQLGVRRHRRADGIDESRGPRLSQSDYDGAHGLALDTESHCSGARNKKPRRSGRKQKAPPERGLGCRLVRLRLATTPRQASRGDAEQRERARLRNRYLEESANLASREAECGGGFREDVWILR